MFRPHQRVIHVASGKVYRIVDVPPRLRCALTQRLLYSYTLETGAAQGDIALWVSTQQAMEDGRFKAVELPCG